ncbi:MAG: porin [Pseudomonadales bacterium]|nr:porin [Pseudomonadales bacterium]
MKTKLLLLSASILAANVAMADVTVYGKINTTLLKYDQEDLATGATEVDNWQVTSNASRFGFKGDEALNDGLNAIYQIEYQFGIDDGLLDTNKETDGKEGALKPRNIYLGLKGGWGTFQFGHHDTPTKMISGSKVDMFNDLPLADTSNMMAGENRFTNSMMYRSPAFGGLKFDVMVAPGEDDGVTAGKDKNGIADFISAAVSYNIDALTFSASVDSGFTGQKLAGSLDKVATTEADLIRLVARYDVDAFGVAGLVQMSDDKNSDFEENVFMVSGYYKLDSWKFKAQFVQTDVDEALNYSKTQFIAGADYKLAKSTKVFGYYSMIDDDADGFAGATDSVLGTGIEHKF